MNFIHLSASNDIVRFSKVTTSRIVRSSSTFAVCTRLLMIYEELKHKIWNGAYRSVQIKAMNHIPWRRCVRASSRESRSGSFLVSDHYVFAFWVVAYYPWKPRGGQSGREKRRRQFSKTGERGPGMLLLSNQYHDSFELLSLIGHKNNRRPAIPPIALLSWSSYSKG